MDTVLVQKPLDLLNARAQTPTPLVMRTFVVVF